MDSNLCTAAKVSEVQKSLDDEDGAIEQLATEIDKLSSRISLILGPASDSMGVPDPNKRDDPKEKCDLANIIDDRVRRISNLYYQVQSLCDHVQL